MGGDHVKSVFALSLFAITALGCESKNSDWERERWNRALATVRDPQASDDARKSAATEIVPRCCSASGPAERFAEAACTELEATLTGKHGTLSRSVDSGWGPSCYERIPSRLVLDALARETDAMERNDLVVLLRDYAPDSSIARAVLEAHLDPRTQSAANVVLAEFGEDQLLGFLSLLADPKTRRDALQALIAVLEAPLDSAPLLRAARELRTDPDQEVATFAQIVVSRFERFAAKSADEAFLTSVGSANKERVRRWLQRRRALCASNAARVRAAEVLAPAEIAARDQMCSTVR